MPPPAVLRTVHVPKCAGSTLRMTLDAHRAPDAPDWRPLTRLCRNASAAFAHVALREAHHRTYAQWLDLDGCAGEVYRWRHCRAFAASPPARVVLVGVFRRPADRFASAYNMARGRPDGHCGFLHCDAPFAAALATARIGDAARAYGRFRGAHNLQTRYLGVDPSLVHKCGRSRSHQCDHNHELAS